MRLWLFVLFVVVPVIELAVIIQVGGLIGAWPTIGLLLASGIAGSWLMRRQGMAALLDLQRAFREFLDPTGPIAHGALILFAGALMLAPGFISDLTGLALLLPPVRRFVIRSIGSRIAVTRAGFGFPGGTMGGGADRGADGFNARRDPHRPPVVDAEFVDIEPPRPPRRDGPSAWTRP
ncbi:FxsA family protein [Paracoccus aeridis]|uniref:FxsA family protein n=1 Tax=Paracoccus aeridis TaxID=1966466 RepID=UPI0010AA08E9|nr:FxsA family protein [Paracoccus aeridis]